MSTTNSVARPRFAARSPLRTALDRRVKAYFAESGLSPHGGRRFAVKAGLMLAWAATSYLLLLFWASSPASAIPLAVSLGLAVAGIGFSVMHDGNHRAAAGRPWLNRLAGGTLDAIGGSSYVWRHKHNVLHHTYTNIEGVDDDLDAGPFLRLAPTQRRRSFHRLQHLYELPLLGFLAAKWVLLDDWLALARGKVGGSSFPRPRGSDLAQLLGGKLFFYAWALGLPLVLHPPLPVLLVFALSSAVLGMTLGIVFQLAHVVEGAQSLAAPTHSPEARLQPWVEHQLATTADFAPRSRLLSWYVGGLNFQIEHHLFPRISHVHYPALAEIVCEVCEDFGVRVLRFATLREALGAHFRLLAALGRSSTPAGAENACGAGVGAAADERALPPPVREAPGVLPATP
ncbi:MAG: acyl-CoA desaturase [Planctomycetota bacterium]|nr:MAG: acyl-CoA desaturase [Planctomycetota bacterium]